MDRIAWLVERLTAPPVLYTLAALFVMYVVVKAVFSVRTRRRKRELKAEYDRIVREQVAARQADGTTEAPKPPVVIPPERNPLRSLPAADRRNYEAEWTDLQASFVESPAAAVVAADRLIVDVMKARGYPVEKFPQLPDLVATFHPHAAVTFRAAHALARGNRAQGANLEHLRQSFMHQRTLFEELLDNVQQIDLTANEARRKAPYHRWFREVDHQ